MSVGFGGDSNIEGHIQMGSWKNPIVGKYWHTRFSFHDSYFFLAIESLCF